MGSAGTLTLRRAEILWPPLIAGALAALAALAGWQGVDLPAQLYRVALFHRDGLTLWDSQWYGGHWTLNYSVLFPPVAALLGVWLTAGLSAAGAAYTFDRLLVGAMGRRARLGSLAFALGTLAQIAIGQLTFLLGEALALLALLLLVRDRRRAAIAAALATALASPLAGAFLALAGAAHAIAAWPRDRRISLAFVGAALAPVAVSSVAFPGQGPMPFPVADALWLLALFGAALLLVPREQRTLRIALGLYLLAIAGSLALPTAVGGNISRLGECVGAPLLLVLPLMPRRRVLAVALALGAASLQWGPALATFSSNPSNPSTQEAYFAPLVTYLRAHDTPAGRLEIVPTRLHWEAADVAPYVPLARGWERQLDTADNAIFYDRGALTAASYRAWLLDAGVRFVAVPDAQLDYAGVDEARLIARGVPGLRPVWRNGHWRVYEVAGSPGLVSGPGRLVSLDGAAAVVRATAPGTLLVRVRYAPSWSVQEDGACIAQDPAGWIAVRTDRPGLLHLNLGLVPSSSASC